jgi:hypothetical protein
VYLSELADDSSTSSGNNTNAASGTSTSIGGGGGSSAARKPKDRGNKVLLDAQSKLLQSRTKRRERGDSKWVRDLEQQRRDIEHESADLCALATEDRHSTQDSTKDVGEALRQVRQVRQVRQPGKDAREAFLASNSMARALKARYVVVASEGFSFKKRGEFWGNVKRKKQQRQQQGGPGGEGGGGAPPTYFWETWKGEPAPTHHHHDEVKEEESTLTSGEVDQELDAWPDAKMTKVERAEALASAAALEANIKSDVWQVVSGWCGGGCVVVVGGWCGGCVVVTGWWWLLVVVTGCGYSLWLLVVVTGCGYSLWLLVVVTGCGYWLWLRV